jgi:hypothetical protein
MTPTGIDPATFRFVVQWAFVLQSKEIRRARYMTMKCVAVDKILSAHLRFISFIPIVATQQQEVCTYLAKKFCQNLKTFHCQNSVEATVFLVRLK